MVDMYTELEQTLDELKESKRKVELLESLKGQMAKFVPESVKRLLEENPEADTLAEEETAWPPFPSVHTQWDEATCAQVVYVFSETHEHFGGRPEDFFEAIRRKGKAQDDRRITIASIDVGGGTTDLVVSDYRLDTGQGANVYIERAVIGDPARIVENDFESITPPTTFLLGFSYEILKSLD